jgi:hypothetical protein
MTMAQAVPAAAASGPPDGITEPARGEAGR